MLDNDLYVLNQRTSLKPSFSMKPTVQYQPDCNLSQCLENSPVSFLTEKSAKMAGRLISNKKYLPKEENL